MKCKYCNSEIPDGAERCLYCCRLQSEQPTQRVSEPNSGDIYYTRPGGTQHLHIGSTRRPPLPEADEDTVLDDEMPARRRHTNVGWIVTACLLITACILLAVWAFVPGVRSMFDNKDTTTVNAGWVPGYLDPGMPLSSALQVNGVTLSIITSYEVGEPPVHTLYLKLGDLCYETNVTDADGGWCYLTPEGKLAMQRALSNSGRIESFDMNCVDPDAQILAESRRSPQQIQDDFNRQRQYTQREIADLVVAFYNSKSTDLLTRSAIAKFVSARNLDQDPLFGTMHFNKVWDLKTECTDLQKGEVRLTATASFEDDISRTVGQLSIIFTVSKSEDGRYLISGWSAPRFSETSTESKIPEQMPDIMDYIDAIDL